MATKTVDTWGIAPICVRLAERFEDIVARNPTLRIEQTANGEVMLMSRVELSNAVGRCLNHSFLSFNFFVRSAIGQKIARQKMIAYF